jgi:anti-sigma-K factor RskA
VKARGHELHQLTGAYALDALPADEQADVEKHLDDCPSCTEEVRGLRETAARLGMATAVSPPPEMRARVLAALPQVRQLPPPGGGRHSQVRQPRRRIPRVPVARTGVTAGVLALAAALVFLIVTQVSTSNQLHQQQAANHALATVLSAADVHVASSDVNSGGTLTAVVSPSQREAVVTSAHLPNLSGGHVYQLWVITAAGSARSAGLLSLTVSGSSSPVLADGVAPGDQLGLTVEPAGGTSQPTTKPIVLVPVKA